MLVFLFILLIITLIILILVSSKLQIKVINLKFNSQTKKHINKDYKFIIKLYVLGFIPIFRISITKTKLEKMRLQEKMKNVDFKLLEFQQKFDKRFFTAIKKLNIIFKNINLHIALGTENASLTSIIVPTISTAIAIILRKKMKKFEEQTFIIEPIYQNQNLVNIYFSGIFEIKMRHIINIIYILSKKEKEGVNEYERTSNRRPYDYSYE